MATQQSKKSNADTQRTDTAAKSKAAKTGTGASASSKRSAQGGEKKSTK